MTRGRGRGPAGGRGNEGGSLHRAGIAAYLAAYGLLGRRPPLGDDTAPGAPERLWLEAAGAVDDIHCRFAGGGRWELQAKKTCHWDATFSDVVGQWISAVRCGNYSRDDRVALVAGHASKPLGYLGDAFRRRRRATDDPLLRREHDALERLRVQAVSDGWADIFTEVVSRAMVIEFEAENSTHARFAEGAALLDGSVVATDHGAAAMNALARFFHEEAGRSGASGSDEWLGAIERALIPPGPSSRAAVAGRARAIQAYRHRLGEQKDLLDVDHLAGGAAPMAVPDLLETFQVTLPDAGGDSPRDSASLSHLARRWRRFGVVGLPGSGKTTALEQLAAAWAVDVEAPLPILVRLETALPMLRSRRRLQVDDWCKLGEEVSDDIVPMLADFLREGRAALLLDGLDECRDQQGRAAAAIRALVPKLSPETSLIFSVREVASRVASTVGLPLTVLDEPRQLDGRVLDLVEHVGRSEGAPPHDLEARRQWVEKSQQAHRDVWRIPLFAVLLAVHAARTESSELPATRAEALVAAVEDSVRRWERVKAHAPAAWEPDLHPRMLLEGFMAIGHEVMLDRSTVDGVVRTVAGELGPGWGLDSSRRRAIAEDVVAWWTQRVGAFFEEEGRLLPRLRTFAEVGDAMWVAGAPPKRRDDWLKRVTDAPEAFREPALLAASLDSEVANGLIAAAHSWESVLVAADATLQGASPTTEALVDLVRRLGALFKRPPPPLPETDEDGHLDLRLAGYDDEADGPGWRFATRLARLQLPPGLRPTRDAFLKGAQGERRVVLDALVAATDCRTDGREPNEEERQALQAVLDLPVPEREPREPSRSRGVITISSPTVLGGRAEAAVAAIPLVGLDPATADAAARLSWWSPVDVSDRLRSAVWAAGFEDAVRESSDSFGLGRTISSFLGPDPHVHVRFILSTGSELSAGTEVWTEPWREWRLDAACALYELLHVGRHAIGAGPAAVKRTPEIVRHLVHIAARSLPFSKAVLAAECKRALGMLEEDDLGTAVLLHVEPEPSRRRSSEPPLIVEGDLETLATCLKSPNPWLFSVAAGWLGAVNRPELLAVFWETIEAMWPEHRRWVARWLPQASGRPEVYRDWADGDDPVLRVAAAAVVARTAHDISALKSLLRHGDLMVRVEIVRGLAKNPRPLLSDAALLIVEDEPNEWTCGKCGSVEAISSWDCTNCSTGYRPDLKEEVDRALRNAAENGSLSEPS